MPVRYILSILKASEVLNAEPTLWRLLMLSRTMHTGSLSTCLNSSTDIRPSSSSFSFFMVQNNAIFSGYIFGGRFGLMWVAWLFIFCCNLPYEIYHRHLVSFS